MAHGYPNGKYRGGNQNRSNPDSGPGKNMPHGSSGQGGGNHSQKAKGNPPSKGGRGKP